MRRKPMSQCKTLLRCVVARRVFAVRAWLGCSRVVLTLFQNDGQEDAKGGDFCVSLLWLLLFLSNGQVQPSAHAENLIFDNRFESWIIANPFQIGIASRPISVKLLVLCRAAQIFDG